MNRKSYARSHLFTSPRAFLLAQALRAAPHSILVVSWADQGSALLSVPTKEYLQSSKFVVEKDGAGPDAEFESVRNSTIESDSSNRDERTRGDRRPTNVILEEDEDGDDEDIVDESGHDDAFVAGQYNGSRLFK